MQENDLLRGVFGPATRAKTLVPSASSIISVRGAIAAVAAAAAARSTSSLVTRPPGPVASTAARSTPSSPARLRAAGEALTRPLASRRAGLASRAVRGAASELADPADDEASRAARSSSLSSSPGAAMTATAPVTGTSLPTSATIFRRMPVVGSFDVVDGLFGFHRQQRGALRDRVAFLA